MRLPTCPLHPQPNNQHSYPRMEDSLLKRWEITDTPQHQPAYSAFIPPPPPPPPSVKPWGCTQREGGGCHKGYVHMPVGISACMHWFGFSGGNCLRCSSIDGEEKRGKAGKSGEKRGKAGKSQPLHSRQHRLLQLHCSATNRLSELLLRSLFRSPLLGASGLGYASPHPLSWRETLTCPHVLAHIQKKGA